jgi:MOSC domain-containing protein YiiM
VAHLVSVNLGRSTPGGDGRTGIHKEPIVGHAFIRDPGPRTGGLGSGLHGDFIGSRKHHGGRDQAVYAVAQEELEHWAAEIGRPLPPGAFGENLTTIGLDVDAAIVGETWIIGGTVKLQVAGPRIPCATFAAAIGEPRWVKRFTERGRTGAYLRVLEGGTLAAGDEIVVVRRPTHGIDVPLMFRALTTERHLMPRLAEIADLGEPGERELAAYLARQ